MKGYSDYTKEMREFESSPAFEKYYDAFVKLLEDEGRKMPSRELEELFSTSGSIVRKLVKHARRRCVPVASDHFGYFIAQNPVELQTTIDHMTERKNSIIFTLTRMQNAFSPELPLYSREKERV